MTEPCNDAKRILEYCTEALKEITEEEPAGTLWERRWASLMTLLRTTCAMLQREAPIYWTEYMKTPNAEIKERDSQKSWSPAIFGKFIQTDANLFLHQGILTTGQSRIVVAPQAAVRASAAGEKLEPSLPPTPPLPPVTYYHMNTEPYKGKDPRDVDARAIAWLEEQTTIAEQ